MKKTLYLFLTTLFILSSVGYYGWLTNDDLVLQRLISSYNEQKKGFINDGLIISTQASDEREKLERQLIITNFEYELSLRCTASNSGSLNTLRAPIDCRELLTEEIEIVKMWRVNGDNQAQKPVVILDKQEGLMERMNDVLIAYGRGDDVKHNRWTRVGEKHGIKPEVLVCIAKADSSLGQALKSTNNFGNVGNNDRGDKVHYASPIQGIDAIGKVLNNQYLGTYTTIDQLSRYGNEKGSIYASSIDNWHNNVMNCLSQIHGKTLPDNFNFRTNQ